VFYELQKIQDAINNNVKESETYSSAIGEIETNYGDFLYSAQFFDNQDD
jgi:hypothetical protein